MKYSNLLRNLEITDVQSLRENIEKNALFLNEHIEVRNAVFEADIKVVFSVWRLVYYILLIKNTT